VKKVARRRGLENLKREERNSNPRGWGRPHLCTGGARHDGKIASRGERTGGKEGTGQWDRHHSREITKKGLETNVTEERAAGRRGPKKKRHLTCQGKPKPFAVVVDTLGPGTERRKSRAAFGASAGRRRKKGAEKGARKNSRRVERKLTQQTRAKQGVFCREQTVGAQKTKTLEP